MPGAHGPNQFSMQITITDIIQVELSRRLSTYKDLVAAGQMDRDTANHRYLCLQTALWMAGGCERPAIHRAEADTRAEITRWMKQIQRDSTVATMHNDGRVVALLIDFLEKTKPITPHPVQTKLI